MPAAFFALPAAPVLRAAGIAFFAGSIYATGFLPSGFIPREDASRIVFSLELPPGSLLEDTRQTTDEVTTLMRELPEVENVYVIGGASPTGTLETRRATVVADLKHKSERDVPQYQIEEILLQDGTVGYPDKLRHGETGKGTNDYDAIFRILKSVGFAGWISVEDGMDGLDELRRSVQFLKDKRRQYYGA